MSEDAFLPADMREGLVAAAKSARSSMARHKNHLRSPGSKSEQEKVHIKLRYMKTRKSFDMPRPPRFESLMTKIDEIFGRGLTACYSNRDNEIITPITSQNALDMVVKIADDTGHAIRLTLSKHGREIASTASPSKALSAPSGRHSPPPGTSVRKHTCGSRYIRDSYSRNSSYMSSVIEVPYTSNASSRTGSVSGLSAPLWQGLSRTSSVSSGTVQDITPCGPDGIFQSPRAPVNWRQGNLLGSGSFGRVYRCYDADTGADLAVKIVVIEQEQDKRQMAAFENEMSRMKYVQHPRVVQYLGVERDDTSMHIFMELMMGTIKDEIKNNGALTEKVALKYTSQVLEGLAYLHHNRIIHRDIKSTNVLRDGKGNVKIGDFGSSKQLETICSWNKDTFVGTPYYMPPEAILSGHSVSPARDIWALGITLVEMLTTKVPMADREPLAVIFKIAQNEHPPYELPSSVDARTVHLLKNMLARNANDRASAKALIMHPAFEVLQTHAIISRNGSVHHMSSAEARIHYNSKMSDNSGNTVRHESIL